MSLSAIQPYIKDGVFIFTLTNNGYKFFTCNLLETMKRAGISWKLCIICADRESHRFFQIQGIPAIFSTTLLDGTGHNISLFGSRNFQRLNRLKLDLLKKFTSFPEVRHGIYMDGDISVYNDFVPDILGRLEESSLCLQCDEGSREPCSSPCVNACTGFIAWAHGISSTIFDAGAHLEVWRAQSEDQAFVNALLKIENIPFKTLPRDLYPNGQFLRLYSPGSELKKNAKLLHYNYTVGMDKQRRMQQNGDWLYPLL